MHTHHMKLRIACLTLPLVLAFAPLGCKKRAEDAPAGGATGDAPAPTNRVDINPAVRHNLGITFAKVESRNVARTLRIPGRFELLPTARREYRAAAPGTVELLVQQYQTVAAGTPLYRLDSPRWRETQMALADAEASVKLARAGADSIEPLFAAHENHHTELQLAVDLWTARVTTLEQLKAAGGARGDELAQAKAAMASARTDLAETLEKETELAVRRVETAAQLDAANARLAFLFEAAATLVGVGASDLRAPSPGQGQTPRWQTINAIEVRALAPGVIDAVNVVSGRVIDQHAHVLSTVEPDRVRFRAVGLQSDLPRLTDGQQASVVAPHAIGATDASDTAARFTGTLTLGPTADPERRTLDLILAPAAGTVAPAWARAGASAFLEVVTGGSGGSELAIPLRCVARDGTSTIIFRRDPADPNKAIRMEADLGTDDGRWVVIKSGVAEGNEIVLDGVYQLIVATSGSITKGGHFHPDGTFHEGSD
ncbi:MAG: efflux RND transporter periplasmic adaptor subunit [Phycisphaerales bacterium]|nr:efflux RND transporter periplasmic adaptor subunit [Phycisphaerales bacterium]